MKRFVLITMFFVAVTSQLRANDTIFVVHDTYGYPIEVCFNKYDRALVYAPDGCSGYYWYINNQPVCYDNPIVLDGNENRIYTIQHGGCDIGTIHFSVVFLDPNVPNETTTELWKHQGYPIALESIGADSLEMYDFHWSTGETTPTIEVTEPGIYTCGISDQCATATRTFIVQDNVEISLATCDLETNLNLITWPVTAAQAEYIDHVIVKRDGIQVGTANYTDGQFIDAIGSDAASRTYTLIAVATDGTECPIVSYPKETIHMSYTLGMGNTIEMGWNAPTGYDLLGYNICEWNPNNDNLSVIDFVGASVTSYTCQTSQFDNGNIVIQGVENGKTESRLLSNRSWETVGLGEQSSAAFKVYPNPSNGTFTVEGTGILRIANVLGQEIITKEINGMETIELPQGIYFVQLNDVVRKIVVE